MEATKKKRKANEAECELQAIRKKKGKTNEGVRCGLEFFDQPCEDLARAMLGCVLVCRGENGEECRGEVVEVEAYLGGEDRAAHSFGGRRTAANEAMFMVSCRESWVEKQIMYSYYNVSLQVLVA